MSRVLPGPVASSRWRPSATLTGSMGLHALVGAGLALQPEAWPLALGVVAANHAALGAIGMWPRSALLGPNLRRLPEASRARGEIAITLDDGPDPEVTPLVLDILERFDVRATFFCIGENARRHPDLCREIAHRGHGVENHSDRHLKTFPLLGPRGQREEILAAQRSLASLAGREPGCFRPPAGLRNPLLDPVLHGLGLRHVSWTRRGFDTRTDDPLRVLARLTKGLAAGDILLLHDGHAARLRDGRPVVGETLPRLLEAILARELKPATLAEALAP